MSVEIANLFTKLDGLEDEIAICETNLDLDPEDRVSAESLDTLVCERADVVQELADLGVEA